MEKERADPEKDQDEKINIVIIGAGRGGKALLQILLEEEKVGIKGIADRRSDAPALALAREFEIYTTNNFEEFFNWNDLDVIIDVTGNPEAARIIEQKRPSNVEVIGGLSSKLMWLLVEEREWWAQVLEEIYRIGLRLISTQKSDSIFQIIVRSATQLTNTPAGSIAIWDKEGERFRLGAAIGFSRHFVKSWKLRKGGLTDYIINQDSPIAIPSIEEATGFDNPILLAEGIKAVLAAPLKASGEIVGILYVDDFKPRRFTEREIAVFSLLANKAALAIQKAKLLEQTKELAITDGLTGLYNHRHFLEIIEYEVERARRYKGTFSLMMMDLDNFKEINDNFGHSKGDKVLREVAKVLSKSARHTDFVARYGGDEFVMILPNTRATDAYHVAERIRENIKHIDLSELKTKITITVSIGIAEFPVSGGTKDKLIAAADSALLSCKKKGRDLVQAKLSQ
jgi:diguanylate cyclase (GGDEF)-like protein